MEINKTKKGKYILLFSSVLILLLLGSWWLYLVFNLAVKLEDANIDGLNGNYLKMIQWEGASFFLLLFILTALFLYTYINDLKKTKALQSFFASLTHELKTPLASMKLQTQVLADIIEESKIDKTEKAKIDKYLNRLLDDNLKLENQLDNHLQLSRVQRHSILNLTQINLTSFIKKEIKRFDINFTLKPDKEFFIIADDFALKTIFRNLIENSQRHCESPNPTFEIKNNTLYYTDFGSHFSGDLKSLGRLFYKHNSPKGSGIGLYLIKQLMQQMNGKMEVELHDTTLYFALTFPEIKGIDHE